MKLRTKFSIGISVLIVLPLLLLASVTYMVFTGVMERKVTENAANVLLEMDRRLLSALGEIDALSDVAVVQNDVQTAFRTPNFFAASPPGMDLREKRRIEARLNTLLFTNHKVQSILLYPFQGEGHPIGTPLMPAPGEIRAADWYARVTAEAGRPVWLGPGENEPVARGKAPLLSHVRLVKDYHSLKDLGLLVFNVKLSALDTVFDHPNAVPGSRHVLANRDGIVLYDGEAPVRDGGRGEIGQRLAPQLVDLIRSAVEADGDVKAERDGYTSLDGEEQLVTVVPSAIKGWYFLSFIPKTSITVEFKQIRNVTILLLILSLLAVLLFDRLFVSRVVRTISHVARLMQRVEQGDFMIKANASGNDEASALVQGFNRMVRQIERLLRDVDLENRRKRRAEWAALQAQIQPHFMYNTLESINSLAVLQGNREISRMVIALGKLLRIAMSGDDLITVRQELEHIRSYLAIQKFRYRDKFDFSIEVDPALEFAYTPKLILQPLAENALVHGIEHRPEGGRLDIVGRLERGWIHFLVSDNGPGIGAEKLQAIQEQALLGNCLEGRGKRGIGLLNVHWRLRMRFGDKAGVMICTAPGCGTTVRIRIPLTWSRRAEATEEAEEAFGTVAATKIPESAPADQPRDAGGTAALPPAAGPAAERGDGPGGQGAAPEAGKEGGTG